MTAYRIDYINFDFTRSTVVNSDAVQKTLEVTKNAAQKTVESTKKVLDSDAVHGTIDFTIKAAKKTAEITTQVIPLERVIDVLADYAEGNYRPNVMSRSFRGTSALTLRTSTADLHLIVTHHGLWGKASQLEYLAGQFSSHANVIVENIDFNSGENTMMV